MSIVRIQKHTKDFVILNKRFLDDMNISLKLKGFLAYCLCKPDDWHFRVSQLASIFKEGKDCILAIIKEGMEAGYIERIIKNDSKGRFLQNDYIIKEIPDIKEKVPQRENPATEKPALERQTLTKDIYIPRNEDTKNNNKPIRSENVASVKVPADVVVDVEKIFYKGRNGELRSIERSEIFSHFLKLNYPSELISRAIQQFQSQKKLVGNALKLIEAIARSIHNEDTNTSKFEDKKEKEILEKEEYKIKLEDHKKKPKGKIIW